MIWLVTVLTTPVLYGVLILIFLFTSEYYPNRHFDQKVWKTDSDRRYEYSHDLVDSKILMGKTKKQVIQVLGDRDTSNNEIYYYIGYRPEIGGIDPSSIIIDFKNGKVDSVFEHDK